MLTVTISGQRHSLYNEQEGGEGKEPEKENLQEAQR